MTTDKEQLSFELSQLSPEALYVLLILCIKELSKRMNTLQAQISKLKQKSLIDEHFFEQMCEDYEHE